MRYSFFVEEDGQGHYVDHQEDPVYGEWVKYEDIKHLHEPTSEPKATRDGNKCSVHEYAEKEGCAACAEAAAYDEGWSAGCDACSYQD